MKGSVNIVVVALLACAAGASVADESRVLQIRHAIESGSANIPYPTNDGELSTFFGNLGAKYGGKNVASALHQTYLHEQRDNDWAPKMEDHIAAAASEHQKEGIVVKADCRTSICRVDVTVPAGKSPIAGVDPFAKTLIVSLREANIPVVVTNRTDEKPQTGTLYIYSVAPPEHFADDLVARLKNPS